MMCARSQRIYAGNLRCGGAVPPCARCPGCGFCGEHSLLSVYHCTAMRIIGVSNEDATYLVLCGRFPRLAVLLLRTRQSTPEPGHLLPIAAAVPKPEQLHDPFQSTHQPSCLLASRCGVSSCRRCLERQRPGPPAASCYLHCTCEVF